MLREKNKDLNLFFNVSLDLLCVANMAGYFVRLNPAFEKILGYTIEELKAEPFLEFVHPDDRDVTKEALAKLGLQKVLFDFINRYRCKDGTYRWLEWRAVPSGKFIYGAARDITERKVMEDSLRERLEFEQLFSDLSAAMVKVPLNSIDRGIEATLGKVLELFNVDRCGLLRVSLDHNAWRITHLAVAEGLPPLPTSTDLSVDLFPYGYKRIVEEQKVWSFTSLDDLPIEAGADKQTFKEWGIRSMVNIPIAVVGSNEYFMAMTADRKEHVWLEEYIPRLRMLGEVFINVLERRQSRIELEERLQFESLLAELSGRFVNVTIEQVDSEINDAIQKICEHLGFDLAALWQWTSGDPRFFTMTHLYRPMPGPPPPERIEALDMFPWCLQQLAAGKVIAVSTDDLPAEASRDQETWRHYGIKSVLTFPLSAGGRPLFGALGFNTIREKRQWPKEVVKRLQLVAEIFANVLSRKNSEQILRESEERLDLAASSADIGMWVLDAHTGHIWASDKARVMFGFGLDEELYLEKIINVCHPDDRERIRLNIEMSFESGEYSGNEYRILLPDGCIRWLATRGRTYLGLSGTPERIVGVAMDITERKLDQAEIHRARTELLRVERMLSLGELVASLAHELNQPLAAILSSAQAALRFLQSTSPDLNLIRTILQNVVQDDKRAAGVIMSLRSLVKKEEREKEVLSIREVLEDVLNLFRSEAIIRHVEIKTDFESSLPSVYGDRIQLQQVVLNLITNAVEVVAGLPYVRRNIILRTQATDQGVQVAVRDFGTGIDPSRLDDIWEPFFTTKKAGLGMGLSICRSIIRAHEGRIWAENNPDFGITFAFEIPAIVNEQALERNL
jgi:two-component system sensor kinase FixL